MRKGVNTSFQEYSELVQKSTMLRNKIDDKLVPHKISLLESLYRIPAHITGNEISHLDLKEISADINNLSLNPSKDIPKNISKEEETSEDNV